MFNRQQTDMLHCPHYFPDFHETGAACNLHILNECKRRAGRHNNALPPVPPLARDVNVLILLEMTKQKGPRDGPFADLIAGYDVTLCDCESAQQHQSSAEL